MSQKAYTYATTKDTGNPARQLLLYVIAEHINVETGITYSSIKTLMRECKIKSDRTLRNHLARLEEDGFIRRYKRQRANGTFTSDDIELVGFITWATTSCGVVAEAPAKITAGKKRLPRQKLPDPPVGSIPDPSVDRLPDIEPTIEPSNEDSSCESAREDGDVASLERETKQNLDLGTLPETFACGVTVSGDLVKHAGFAISLQAIAMSIAGRWPPDKIKNFCLAHALQWAAEISAGKLSRDVVPDKIVNFLSASIMREINREAAAEMQAQRGAGPSRNSVHPKVAAATEARKIMWQVAEGLASK